jgi:glycogen synthase
MVCGKAIVASDLAGWRDVLRDGENALLVTPDDAPTLAHAIARLQQDSPLKDRLGASAKHDSAQYTWQARAESIRNRLIAP